MNIVVCIKQVPNVAEIKFDPRTKTIIREGVSLQMSSLDRRALWAALELRNAHGGAVTAISMGPPQARTVCAQALALGADKAVLLSDRAFAGSDTLATSRTLAAAIRKLEYDLVFCGRFTLDSETAQVGPQVAEFLGIPHATNVMKVEYDSAGNFFRTEREVEEGRETIEIDLPCLLTAGEFLNRPPMPTPEQMAAVDESKIGPWSAADVGLPESEIGSAGSPTQVYDIREFTVPREQRVVSGQEPQAMAKQLVDYLMEKGLFTTWDRASADGFKPAEKTSPRDERAIWVVGETSLGQLKHVTLELLGSAAQMAAGLTSEVSVVLMGEDLARFAETLAAHGADKVLLAEHPSLAHYHPDAYSEVLAGAISARKPWAVLLPATVNGRDLAPRVAARLGLGLTGDCIGLEVDQRERLVQLKPAFGGNIVAPIRSSTLPAMATIRPGMLSAIAPVTGRKAKVESLPVATHANGRIRITDFKVTAGEAGTDLEGAETIVGVGAGLGNKENLGMMHDLANAMGGTVGTTLAGVREGILPGPLQIGLTGRSVAPRFYVAVAISGQLNHMIGLQRAGTIVAINKDPEAPMFKNADFGIVGNYQDVVPHVTRLVAEARAGRA